MQSEEPGSLEAGRAVGTLPGPAEPGGEGEHEAGLGGTSWLPAAANIGDCPVTGGRIKHLILIWHLPGSRQWQGLRRKQGEKKAETSGQGDQSMEH